MAENTYKSPDSYNRVGFDIPIHEESVEYIKEVLGNYKIAKPPLPECLTGKIIIHMYAKEDTMDEDGNLNGYEDALYFRPVIHVVDTRKAYKLGVRDGIWLDKCVQVDQIKIFKDGSTLVALQGPIRILDGQALLVERWHDE